MNIVRIRQEERARKIAQIKNSLKNSEQFKAGKLDKKEIVVMMMSFLGIAKRTASEYVDVALFELKNDEIQPE